MHKFSEIFERETGNHQSDQQMSIEFPVPEDDLVELVWDKGQITMRSQSSRVRNSQNCIPRDKYAGNTAAFDSFESFLDDAPLAVPSGEADLSLVDDRVPWFDDFLPETSDVTMSELPMHNSLTPLNKSSVQTFESLGNSSVFNNQKLVHTNGVDTHSSTTGPGSSWSTPQGQPLLGFSKVHSTPKGSQLYKLSCSAKLTNRSNQEAQGKIVSSDPSVIGANPNRLDSDGENTVEPVIATSSVCSESSADKTSNCQMQNLKRKDRDSEKADYLSEDVEEERVGVRKSAPGREGAGLKRNRDTEVHNLSERRRRERINEKMRALQELMPNCNKVDKASMLDEVIDYLKTLQRQVQMMSTGAGVYMPQMMIPAAMQQMHAAHVSHFAPMGMGTGIGMGMGYGMEGTQMFNTNGSPMFSDPSVQRPHFPSPLGSPNLPNLGYPGQGLSISVPRAPLNSHVSTTSSVCVNATSLGSQVEMPSAFPTLNSMDRVPSNDPQRFQDADVSFSMDLVTTQSQRIKSINSNPPPLQQNNSLELHGIDDGNVNLTNENVALVEKQVLPNPEGVETIT